MRIYIDISNKYLEKFFDILEEVIERENNR